jgi:antitoxin MazE
MQSVYRTRVVRIGNSKGLRLPKLLIDQLKLEGEVELLPADGQLVVRPVLHPRAGWDDALKQMHAYGDDVLLDATPVPATAWDDAEWEW